MKSKIPPDSIAGRQIFSKRARSEVAEIQRIIGEIQKESPYTPSEANLEKIFTYLWNDNLDFTLENVREAVQTLTYYNQFD